MGTTEQSSWAEESLRVIRELVERGAIYRRHMAPVLAATGTGGIAGGALALGGGAEVARSAFTGYWLAVAALTILACLAVLRRQARACGERVLSPPARRVLRALVPPFAAGLLLSMALTTGAVGGWAIVAVWLLLYGCGVHAARAFLPRELAPLGWVFLAAGVSALLVDRGGVAFTPERGHAAMASLFGGVHLAFAAWMRMTESGT